MAAEYGVRCKDCASHNGSVLCSWKNQFSLFVFPNCGVSRILIFHENFGWMVCCSYIVETHTYTYLISQYPSIIWHSTHSAVEWMYNLPPSNCLALCVYNSSDCKESGIHTLNYKCNTINITVALQHAYIFHCGDQAGITATWAHAVQCRDHDSHVAG